MGGRVAVALLVAISASASAQERPVSAIAAAESLRMEIDAAVATGDAARIDRAIAFAERAITAFPGDVWLEHYLGFAHFRASNQARGMRDERKLKMHLEQAEKALQRSLALKETPESHALLSGVLGQMIGGPIAGMRLGPRADRALDRALALGPRNPRVWAVRASASLYKPKLFGGSAEKAEEYARKAIEFVATDSVVTPAPRWGESDAYTFLGQALAAQKKFAEAKVAYERVLALEPGNGYITYVLMPALKKQMP
jgi:tetratricopeptide (TPR) repeat protein